MERDKLVPRAKSLTLAPFNRQVPGGLLRTQVKKRGESQALTTTIDSIEELATFWTAISAVQDPLKTLTFLGKAT